MNRSESIVALAKSLAAFHAHAPAIIKNATNPHFRNSYADLGGILDAIRTPLAEQGLSVLQLLGENNITTMLLHTSGEYIETTTPLVITKLDAQGFGSAVSYQRRYALSAILSLAAQDDDGNAACKPVPVATPVMTRDQVAVKQNVQKLKSAVETIEKVERKEDRDLGKELSALMQKDKVEDDQVFAFLYAKKAKVGEAEYIGDLSKPIMARLIEVWDEVKAFTPVAA